MTSADIIAKLPYSEPFLFVDEILEVDEKEITGTYRFRETADFYRGHFIDHPVTPGVILTECMAQIALVSHGIFLLNHQDKPIPSQVAFASAQVDFLKPVFPRETVQVKGKLVYFRMGKIKSEVVLLNDKGEACKGVLTGMLKS